MVETTKKTLVKLVLKGGNNSEDPKLCIVTNDEVAENPVILSNILVLRYSGPDFESYDGTDFKEEAIIRSAPRKANAYLMGVSSRNAVVMCSDVHTPIVYFHIDEKQANRAPQPKKPYRSIDSGNYYDGEAD